MRRHHDGHAIVHLRHLWAIEYRFDWGRALLWSGWDGRWDGPSGDLLPILFRARRGAREWIAANVRGRGVARPVRVEVAAPMG